jgi:hypothetical protein
MRKIILLGMILSSAALLLAAQNQTQAPAPTLMPLNVTAGLWQVTMTSTVNGAPNTSNYQSCVKQADLGKYPFTDPKANCTWTVTNSTGTVMDANGTCMPANIGKVTFTMHLVASDTQDVKGTGQLTFNGPAGTLNGSYVGTGKWVSATCPAGMK